MEQNSTRLHSLDGLRGLAVLLVFLNHLTPSFILASFPFLGAFGLFSSGITGVSFFFILSGFLMSYLYPVPKSNIGFLQKRYTRIFPLFLTMCTIMLALTLFPKIYWIFKLALILILALIVNFIWVHIIKKQPEIFSRVIFLLFIFIQIIVGGFYCFYIMRHPPALLQTYSQTLQNIIFGFVNATLTFPLGNYFPMLDGVYWSLASEILFYILYPFVIVPLVLILVPRSNKFKIIFLLSLLPFIAGVNILSKYIADLNAFQFSLFYYFAIGIFLGWLYRKKQHLFSYVPKLFRGKGYYLPIIIFFALIPLINSINTYFPSSFSPWTRLLFAFPLGLVVAFILDRQTSLYRFFASKILVFLGSISYSIYLSHTAIIHIIDSIHKPTSLSDEIITIIITFITTVLISGILYLLLEKPYFYRKKENKVVKEQPIKNTNYELKGKLIFSTILLAYFFAIFIAFQSEFNLFSIVTNIGKKALIYPKNTSNPTLSLKNIYNAKFLITATENNLGIIAVSINHYNPGRQGQNTPMLIFTLSQVGMNNPIFSTEYVLDEFRGKDFPFGFPTIPNSKGKNYVANFSVKNPSTINYLTIDSQSVKAIYQLDKSTIFKNPKAILLLLFSKAKNVFNNSLSSVTLLLFIPLGIMYLFIILKSLPKKINY